MTSRYNKQNSFVMSVFGINQFLLICLVLFVGCSKTDSDLVDSQGVFSLQGVSDKLKVSISSDLVHAEMLTLGKGIKNLNREGSVYSRWFFWWDKQSETLWYYNGDVGVFFYEANDGYRERVVKDGDSVELPAGFSKLID